MFIHIVSSDARPYPVYLPEKTARAMCRAELDAMADAIEYWLDPIGWIEWSDAAESEVFAQFGYTVIDLGPFSGAGE